MTWANSIIPVMLLFLGAIAYLIVRSDQSADAKVISSGIRRSRLRKAAREALIDVAAKVMVWSPLVALFAYITHGEYLPADAWTALLPVAVAAGFFWGWLVFSGGGDE